VEKRGPLRHTCRLLHIVGHDDDSIFAAQVVDQFFDTRRCNGIKRGAGFVHQDDFGINGNSAGDAQTLLLPAGKRGAAVAQAILYLAP